MNPSSHPRTAPNILTPVNALPGLLSPIYGCDVGVQIQRYQDALYRFRERYGPGPAALFRAPGRINLIGGHTDYNRGYVMPVALDRDLVLVARPNSDGLVRLNNMEPEFPDDSFRFDSSIPHSKDVAWTNYIRGAAQRVATFSSDAQIGVDCLVVGQAPFGIPRGSGLSSSSALTVAAFLVFAHFAHLNVERDDLVQLCSDAEWYVGTRGGIMDQYISLFARRDHALFLDCQPDEKGKYRTELVPLPEDYEIIVAESGVRHDNVRGEYNKRVASCRAGMSLLRMQWPDAAYLRDLEAVDWEELEPLLPDELSVADALRLEGSGIGDIPGLLNEDVLPVQACCRHVWQENRRVRAAHDALQAGDVQTAGRLISQAHASARDNYQISFPEMETLVRASAEVPGVAGGRLTGAGCGGCAVFLVERTAVASLTVALEYEFERCHGYRPSLFLCRSGTAAGYVGTVAL